MPSSVSTTWRSPPSQERLRVAVVIGSTRKGRFGPTVADWYASRARNHGAFEVDVIDLAQAWLPDVLSNGPMPPAVTDLAPWLAAADAFVIVTPEYNHSFPAALKNAIDWFDTEWQAKPVGFVSYGGASGGLRAVEALRLVFVELHAASIREAVGFPDCAERFAADGWPTEPEWCDAAAMRQLDQLAWWARALRETRTRDPYVR